jgi:hypothetical protein
MNLLLGVAARPLHFFELVDKAVDVEFDVVDHGRARPPALLTIGRVSPPEHHSKIRPRLRARGFPKLA